MKPVNENYLTTAEILEAFHTKTPMLYRLGTWTLNECEEVTPDEWKVSEILNQVARDDNGDPTTVFFYYAPRMLKIGDREVHAGETTAPKEGTHYFITHPSNQNYCMESVWSNDDLGNRYLNRGLVHLTKENAIKHAKAIILASGGSI